MSEGIPVSILTTSQSEHIISANVCVIIDCPSTGGGNRPITIRESFKLESVVKRYVLELYLRVILT